MSDEPLDFASLCGWQDNPEAVLRDIAQMPFPSFAQAAPDLMARSYGDSDVLLYKALKEVLGQYPDYTAQKIGDCTSFGQGHVVDLLACIEIAIGKEPEAYKETCTEAIYGTGRRIGKCLGPFDGCYGAAVARAVTEVGVVPREAVGEYDGSRAKKWGMTGTPADIEKLAGEHKVGTTALVSTLEEADAALANGYPFTVCSNQGFTMTRDSDGFCRPQGSWAHCMSVIAKRTTGRIGYLIGQSWGSKTPSGPLSLDQPSYSFWVEPDILARMLRGKDSFAASKFNGYPGRPLPSTWTYAAMA